MSRARKRVVWWRRIGVRMALLAAATMLAFDQLRPWIEQRVAAHFGVPERFIVRDDNWIVDELLVDAFRVADGRWEPDPDVQQRFDSVLVDQGFAYLWLDMEGAIVSRSKSLPWEVDTLWPGPYETYFEVPSPFGRDEPALGILSVVERDGVEAGMYLELLVDRERHAQWHGIALAQLDEDESCYYGPHYGQVSQLTLEEFEASVRFWERNMAVFGVVTKTLMALLLAYALSRVVTRRISRLSREAARPLAADERVPGPFSEGSADEIGLLAGAMNSMRARVLDLVGRLEQRDSERRQWIAQVSHDLRTPLTALSACLERARSMLDDASLAPGERARLREVLNVAALDAERIGVLTEDLLEVARLDASSSLRLEPVPPGQLLRQAVTGLGPMAEVHGVRLTVEVEPGLPIPQADGRRLTRAMENLLRNAIQHAGGEVRATASLAQDGVRFEVLDDGPGLPETDGSVVFEELRNLRSREDSAGLGLQVAEKVALAHGGRIGAYNRPSGGAVFWFEVPAGDREPPTKDAIDEGLRRRA